MARRRGRPSRGFLAAGAVLIGAPVYRASFPGVLKNLLDIAPVEALQNKPVGILAMGGSAHHYLAVDTQLRGGAGLVRGARGADQRLCHRRRFQGGTAGLGKRPRRSDCVDRHADRAGKRLDPATLGPKPLAARFT